MIVLLIYSLSMEKLNGSLLLERFQVVKVSLEIMRMRGKGVNGGWEEGTLVRGQGIACLDVGGLNGTF